MIKRKKYILVVVLALTLVITLHGSYMLKQKRTHSLRVEKAIKCIEEALYADPNYIVTEGPVVKVKGPDISDPSSFLHYLHQGLQVSVRKLERHGPPSWAIKLDIMLKRLPSILRPNRNLYLKSSEYNWIGITAVEPTTEELQKLKDQVLSLSISRDIEISFSPYYPDRERMQQELLNNKMKLY